MKSLHKIILFALLPLMGACSGMLDIEPHSAVSPTVVGSDDIEALRIGMYNKVQEGPTYYSYIAFDLFGGELMSGSPDRGKYTPGNSGTRPAPGSAWGCRPAPRRST